jgi:hypothetical protein
MSDREIADEAAALARLISGAAGGNPAGSGQVGAENIVSGGQIEPAVNPPPAGAAALEVDHPAQIAAARNDSRPAAMPWWAQYFTTQEAMEQYMVAAGNQQGMLQGGQPAAFMGQAEHIYEEVPAQYRPIINALPPKRSELQIIPPTPNQFTHQLEIAKFHNDGTLLWEEFEATIKMRTAGKLDRHRVELLQMSMGPSVTAWYTNQRNLWQKSFAEHLAAMRKNFSRKREGERGMGITQRVIWQNGDTVDSYSIRANRACLHLDPGDFVPVIGETKEKETARRIQHYGDLQTYDMMIKNTFVNGLPEKWRTRLFNNHTILAGPLNDMIEKCKTWEYTDKIVKEGTLTNRQLENIAYQTQSAHAYHTRHQEAAGESESDDDYEPPFVGLANSLLVEPSKKKKEKAVASNRPSVDAAVDAQISRENRQKNIQALIAKIDQFDEKIENMGKTSTEKIAEQVKTLGEMLPERMKKLMTEDAKPTAKAGTKGDPSTEQADATHNNRRNNFGRNNNGNFQNNNGQQRVRFQDNSGNSFNRRNGNQNNFGQGNGYPNNNNNGNNNGNGFPRGDRNAGNDGRNFNSRGNGNNNFGRGRNNNFQGNGNRGNFRNDQPQPENTPKTKTRAEADTERWNAVEKLAETVNKAAAVIADQTTAFAHLSKN